MPMSLSNGREAFALKGGQTLLRQFRRDWGDPSIHHISAEAVAAFFKAAAHSAPPGS